MRLHWGWAVPGALLLGGALVWWNQPEHRDATSAAGSRLSESLRRATAHTESGPTLYRWVDAHGVVNVSTEKPPAGARFTIVHIDPDQNVVPMRSPGNGK